MTLRAATRGDVDRVELVEGYGIRWRGAGRGPLLVWAHDAFASVDDDDNDRADHLVDLQRLTSTNRVVRFDAVGHGRSAGVFDPADHEWTARGATLVDLAHRLELPRFAAGGTGAGAAAALHAAVRAPGRVDRLVLVAPTTDWNVPGPVQRLPRPVGLGLLVGAAEPLRLLGRCAPLPPARDPVSRYRAAGFRRLVEAPRNRFNAVLIGAARSAWPEADELAALDIPVLVLALRGDPVHPVRTAVHLADELPGARLEVAADSDEVAAWTERIAAFLAE